MGLEKFNSKNNFIRLNILDNMIYFVHDTHEQYPGRCFDEFKIYYTKKFLYLFELKKLKHIKIPRIAKKYYNRDTSDGRVEGWYYNYKISNEANMIYNMLNDKFNKFRQNLRQADKIENIVQDLRKEYIDGSEYSIIANLVLDKIEKKLNC